MLLIGFQVKIIIANVKFFMYNLYTATLLVMFSRDGR